MTELEAMQSSAPAAPPREPNGSCARCGRKCSLRERFCAPCQLYNEFAEGEEPAGLDLLVRIAERVAVIEEAKS